MEEVERRIRDLERIVSKFWIDVPGGPSRPLTLTEAEEEVVIGIADREMRNGHRRGNVIDFTHPRVEQG